MNNHADLMRQRTLIASLSAALQKTRGAVELFETHLSWVLVAGGFAYKFKKAVRFDFVDFSTLELRHFFCREELRLNMRLAPDIYLDVVAVAGLPEQPVLGGPGRPIEYAVKMRAFEQQALWSYRLRKGLITPGEADRLAERLGRFHESAAPADSRWCTPASLQAIADDTLEQIERSVQHAQDQRHAADLHQWEVRQREHLHGLFEERNAIGAVRECHGDLHGGNLLTMGGEVEAFDCIEFNDSLRWIDVMNDIAFVCMDLRFRQRPDLAARFLSRYLEHTGDYGGLPVLRYYEVHRALIRCKVALLRVAQIGDTNEAASARREGSAYLAFAAARIAAPRPMLMIMHGFSGSGKSTFAECAVEAFDAIRLRSDVERKRMHGMSATARAGVDLYRTDASWRTYERLRELAVQAVRAGWPVVVDASFLKGEQRLAFRTLAEQLGVPFRIFDIRASEAVMKARIAARERLAQDASDAGLAVLVQQLVHHEPLSADEMRHVIAVDFDADQDQDAVRKLCRRIALRILGFS